MSLELTRVFCGYGGGLLIMEAAADNHQKSVPDVVLDCDQNVFNAQN